MPTFDDRVLALRRAGLPRDAIAAILDVTHEDLQAQLADPASPDPPAGGGGLTIGDAVDRAPYADGMMVPLNGGPALVTAVLSLNAPGASADLETYSDLTGDTSTNLYAVTQLPADAPAGSKVVVSLIAIVPAGGSYYLNHLSADVANLYEQPLG